MGHDWGGRAKSWRCQYFSFARQSVASCIFTYFCRCVPGFKPDWGGGVGGLSTSWQCQYFQTIYKGNCSLTYQVKFRLSWFGVHHIKPNPSVPIWATPFQDKRILSQLGLPEAGETWNKQFFVSLFCFSTVLKYMTGKFRKENGHSLLFVAEQATETKFRRSTEVTIFPFFGDE